jgi:hypothetical protein
MLHTIFRFIWLRRLQCDQVNELRTTDDGRQVMAKAHIAYCSFLPDPLKHGRHRPLISGWSISINPLF